jgi:hypothetical protein
MACIKNSEVAFLGFGQSVDTEQTAMLRCAAKASVTMSSYLNQQVLVLNRLWQAVNVCSTKRALTLLFEGRAQVVLSMSDGSFPDF